LKEPDLPSRLADPPQDDGADAPRGQTSHCVQAKRDRDPGDDMEDQIDAEEGSSNFFGAFSWRKSEVVLYLFPLARSKARSCETPVARIEEKVSFYFFPP